VLGGLALVGGAGLIAYASYKAWDGFHNQPRLPSGQLLTGGAAALAYAQTKAALDALLAQRIAAFVNSLRASLAAYAAQLNQIASRIRVERARIEADIAERLALDRIRVEASRHIELPAVGSTTAIITGTVPLLPEGTEAVNNAAAASIPTLATAEADQTSTNPVALAATMVAATSAVETAQPPTTTTAETPNPRNEILSTPIRIRKGVRDNVHQRGFHGPLSRSRRHRPGEREQVTARTRFRAGHANGASVWRSRMWLGTAMRWRPRSSGSAC
jgi:hypothetical protein